MKKLTKNMSRKYVKGCTSPAKELFINSHGYVYPCIYKKPVTNVRGGNWDGSILGDYHRALIKEGLERECPMKNQHCNFLKITKTALS